MISRQGYAETGTPFGYAPFGRLLGTIFALFRLKNKFCAFLGRMLALLGVFCAFRVVFGWIREDFERILGGFWRVFFMISRITD